MGAEVSNQSNLFLPLGKVRMGYPSGEARWGLSQLSRVDTLGYQSVIGYQSATVISLPSVIINRSNRPSPSGEARWGLSQLSRVTSSFPWGRLGWV